VTIWNVDDHEGEAPSLEMIPSSFYYASLLGLDFALSRLPCKNSLDYYPSLGTAVLSDLLNREAGHHGTALTAASYGDYKKIVQLLLERGADVNAQGGGYGTAIYAA
jgi:hypothetical protein